MYFSYCINLTADNFTSGWQIWWKDIESMVSFSSLLKSKRTLTEEDFASESGTEHFGTNMFLASDLIESKLARGIPAKEAYSRRQFARSWLRIRARALVGKWEFVVILVVGNNPLHTPVPPHTNRQWRTFNIGKSMNYNNTKPRVLSPAP